MLAMYLNIFLMQCFVLFKVMMDINNVTCE